LFFNELSHTDELKEIAQNPLLLSLLISFKISNVSLPRGRFEAYGALTDHLIAIHPQKRNLAADISTQSEFSEADTKKVLARLATFLHLNHSEGLIREDEALRIIVDFLTDKNKDFGMEKYAATEIGKDILSRAEGSLGIIVKKSQDEIGFYHRTIQEYLASFDISRLQINEQIAIVSEHCTDPLWREVVLGLLKITNRPSDVKQLVDAIRFKKIDYLEQVIVTSLLSEVAFGDFNCPAALAKELAVKSFEQINLGTRMDTREQLLRFALGGLRSTATKDLVKEKITEWFPDRLGWGMSWVLESMSEWNGGDDLLETLFKVLNAESYGVKISAVTLLSKIWNGDNKVADRLVSLANTTEDPYIIATVIEGLGLGWSDNKDLLALIEKYKDSLMPALTISVIGARIVLGTNDENDLNKLLKLAGRGFSLHSHREQIITSLKKGWPKSEKVKKILLSALESRYGGQRNSVEPEVALPLLLSGYSDDKDVVDYCVKEIENEEYPFLSLRHDGFRLLGENFKGNLRLIEVLDNWVVKSKNFNEMEVSQAATVGKTATFKARLLTDLKGSVPFWAADSLLKTWDMEDPEIASALLGIVKGPADRASSLGHVMPKILSDKNECRQRLIEILKDPLCDRYNFVIQGLIELGIKNDTEVVDIAIPIIKKFPKKHSVHGLWSHVIKSYSFDVRVRKLAIDSIGQHDCPYHAIASAFGDDPEIRALVLKLTAPLPTSLRQIIARHLSESEVDEDFILSVFSHYDEEKDGNVKVQASIGYHTHLKNSGRDTSDDINKLTELMKSYGPDYDERRFAAFAGLNILGRLDIMRDMEEDLGRPKSKVAINSVEGFRLNVPHVQLLLKHWKQLKDFFGGDFWKRLFSHGSSMYVWNHLAQFGDDYPESKQEILDFFNSTSKKIGAEGLRFLSRVQPKTSNLLEQCLRTIGLNESSPTERFTPDPDGFVSYKDELAAIEIIGEHFGGDEDVLKRINTEKK